MTGEDNTIYHFDVIKNKFNEALDIFTQFFIDPIFPKDGLEREINIVDMEFQKGKNNEDRRLYQLIKEAVVRPGSLLNRFGTGNLESLKVDGIYDIVKDFFEEYYSANLMSVSLVGNHTLDELEKLATDHFSKIKNKNKVMSEYTEPNFDNKNALGY